MSLKKHVRNLLVLFYSSKCWPSQGRRQETSLALAGGLIRIGFSEEEAEKFIEAVTVGAEDKESRDRVKTVIYTARKTGSSPTTRWKLLSELIGQEVVGKVLQWLGKEKQEEKKQYPILI